MLQEAEEEAEEYIEGDEEVRLLPGGRGAGGGGQGRAGGWAARGCKRALWHRAGSRAGDTQVSARVAQLTGFPTRRPVCYIVRPHRP